MKREEIKKHILHWLEVMDYQKRQLVFQVNCSSIDDKGKKIEIVHETVELISEGQFIEVVVYKGCTGNRKAHYRLSDKRDVLGILDQYFGKKDESVAYKPLEFGRNE